MDYKELSKSMRKRYLDNLNVLLQKPDDVFSDCNKAATAITDLLSCAEAAEARAEKAEGERDAAIKQLHGVCSACAHYSPYHNDGLCATCTHEVACFLPEKATDKWEWNGGQKEE